MRRSCQALWTVLLAGALGSCGAGPVQEAEPTHPLRRHAGPTLPSLELAALAELVPGMRPGLGEDDPMPSSLDEVRSFVRSLGGGGCGELTWISDEDGVDMAECAISMVRAGRTRSALRLVLLRFDLPGEDGEARLFRIELSPPARSEEVRDWSSAMVVEATFAHGGAAQTSTAGARFAIWPLDDRYVVLVVPERGDRPTVLVHLGLADPDLSLFGVPE